MGSEPRNPMRFSLRDRHENVNAYIPDSAHVTSVEIKPSEGNVYVHWRDPEEESE